MRFVAEMFGHLRLEGALDHTLRQVLEQAFASQGLFGLLALQQIVPLITGTVEAA